VAENDGDGKEDVDGIDEEDGDKGVTEAEEMAKAKAMMEAEEMVKAKAEGDGGSRNETRDIDVARM